MSYRQKFSDAFKPFGMDAKTWEKIVDARDNGKNVEWECSSFSDPGNDWNKVLIDGLEVWHQDGY